MAEMKHRCERGQNLQMAISARELAETLGISLRQVWRLSSAGKLPKPLKIGGSARWNRQEIVEWFEAGCPDRRTWQAKKEVGYGL
ncbi:MAG: helix-turn-helix domain-containing protein [Planctomycetota bacterium]|nr:helix-turn-helix domain-containing protein [Planctomycetota bacterium]